MSRNNDVFHLLVTKGNQAILAKDKKVTELLSGQIGFFSYDTNLSFDATTTTAPRNFYMAVGVGVNGQLASDIMKSSGSHIQGKNLAFYSFRPHTPGRPQKVLLKDYTAQCNTTYGVKLELRNQEIYMTQGYNQFTKTYAIKTSCCDGCEPTCPSGDANEITRLLALEINNDPNGLVKATAVARQALTALDHGVAANLAKGAVVSDADMVAIMAFNASQIDASTFVYTDLEIETVPFAIGDFNSVHLGYKFPRETVAILTKIDGFECSGSVEVTQTAVFEEGAGIDIKQLEYMTKGWTEGPYRVSSVNGVAENRNFVTDAATKYDVFALTYDQMSLGGWLEYLHNQATIIAIPAADTVTRDAVAGILDKVATPQGFDGLTDDAAAAVTSVTTVETTSSKTVATDGISG